MAADCSSASTGHRPASVRQDKPRTAQLEKPPDGKMTVNLAVTCGDAA